ncbi:MAG TPA: PEGA domain-containing protein, partial [Polyangiaceae bacterium]
MRPRDSKKLMRSISALATGLIVGAGLVAPAAAQTAPSPANKPAPVSANTNGVTAAAAPKPAAAPTNAPAAAPKAATAPAAANHGTAAAPQSSDPKATHTPEKPSASATASSDAKAADKPKAVDKKAQANAKKAYNEATAAYKAGKYDAALVKFQEAESLVPSPNAEYWIAATLDKLDKQSEALAAYASLLANPELPKVGEANVAEAKARFDVLRATVPGELVLNVAPADAKAAIDGQAQADKPPFTVKLSPGDHKVLVTADGYVPQETTVGVEAAKRTNRTIELAALPPPPPEPVMATPAASPPPPPPPAPPQKSLVPAYVTLGIAAVAAGAGTYFGIRALSAKSDYDKTPTSSKADDVENNALIADMAF